MSEIPMAIAGAFGPDFTWGVSTASYQIEGAVNEGGRGPSSWDVFCAQSGRIHDGDTGEIACDHYHRYPEDIALMADLGVDAYRFSFAWPRIQPDASGAVNAEGLAFYDRLIDGLLAAGIEPTPTLSHWDTPQALEELGGWQNREITDRFADYASVLATHFGDRVTRWITLNEPVVLTLVGHAIGMHAPGKTLGFDALSIAHHQLLAHGKAVQALRAGGVGNIGIANNHVPVWRADDSPEAIEAANFYDMLHNRLFADPILLGQWPMEGLELGFPGYQDSDLATISTPIDWYGINYYNPQRIGPPGVKGGSGGMELERAAIPTDLPFELMDIPGYERNDFGWPIIPAGFTELLMTMQSRYGDKLPPITITENGGAFNEQPDESGRVNDQRRINYVSTHLAAIKDAIDAGVDVRGYFHWSLMDNFEWSEGYSQRFGMVHIDYKTQKRTPKDSYAWYRDLIASHR
jgi:beta-glucosidase